ncbi:MAG: aminotransferase class IV [Legionella sp.]|nr:aminotransferase class IV [Legionella sp.]
MTGVVYLNGEFTEAQNATISVFDRGVLFADSVYEVIPVYNGRPYFVDRHLNRLKLNLEQTKIQAPPINWLPVFDELINQNGGGDLQIYLQITRGNQGVRKHDIPDTIKPTFFAFTLHTPYSTDDEKRKGLKTRIIEDFRWQRCDIKTTAMLANILLNDEAVSAGAHTALLSRDGFLLEGSASNVFMIDNKGVIRTSPLNHLCLPGITRQITIELINELKFPFLEGPIPVAEIFSAQELWLTSTTKEIYPITYVNEQQIGSGVLSTYWEELNKKYHQLTKVRP